jgi:hypothetical protein
VAAWKSIDLRMANGHNAKDVGLKSANMAYNQWGFPNQRG